MDIYDKYKNEKLIKSINDKFDIELNNYRVYDQDNSFTCWIYAAYNTIKGELSQILNINVDKIDFSVNYISFYDRVEKLNKLYDEIINNNYKVSDIKYLLFNYVNTEGDFNSFKYLVNKYGLVFENQMPMVDNNFIPQNIDDLLKQKIIQDIEELINQKESNKDLEKLKEKYMSENFKILTTIYGEPPKETIVNNIKLSVNDFYNKYVKDLLNNYISISCLNNLEYGKLYDSRFLNMKIGNEEYLNMKLSDIKEAIIKSLKDKEPVWFGCSFNYMSGSYKNTDGILDDRLYEFDKIGIKKLPKELVEKYNMPMYSHAMVFTGYDSKSGNWKVLNTFGENNNRNGYFIMTDNFFNSSVFMFAINKKYL